MKVGDRVRHLGGKGFPERKGWEGTVTSSKGDTSYVDFDHQGKNYGAYTENLEIIMPAIDTTKPLVDEFDRPFTFITETSEGHILVSTGRGGAGSAWHIFTKQGEFVRSEKNTGTGLTLKNKVTKTCEYFAVDSVPVIGTYYNRQTAWDLNPRATHLIQIDKENGVVTGVGVLKRS